MKKVLIGNNFISLCFTLGKKSVANLKNECHPEQPVLPIISMVVEAPLKELAQTLAPGIIVRNSMGRKNSVRGLIELVKSCALTALVIAVQKKSQFRRKGGAMNAIARKVARDGRAATHLPPGSNYRASRQRKGKVLPAHIRRSERAGRRLLNAPVSLLAPSRWQ